MAERMAGAYSIRRRLLAALLGALACVWLATAVFSYFDARHEVDELLDAHLAQSASLLVAQANHGSALVELEHAPLLHKRARRAAFQVWESGRVLRMHSENAPASRLSRREEGFSSVRIDGKGWRVFSSWDRQRRFLVQVGELSEVRREIAGKVVRDLLVPLLVALPLLGLLIWWSITRALRPLGRIGAEVAGRPAGDLAALEMRDVPLEVAPLVAGLNALLARLGELVENERRFTADAAHELRTPLAALRAQAQVARAAAGAAERNHALENVILACDRAARLVEQLLTLARLAQGPVAGAALRCDVQALARECVAELAPAAIAKGVDLGLAPGGDAPLVGYAGLLGILLRNLVDNAVRYTPAGGAVRVEVARRDGGYEIIVEDEGPGIAPDERDKVGRRFYRIAGSGGSGSGLGLSIVKRIAELHQATLVLESEQAGQGLRARVFFPGPAAP